MNSRTKQSGGLFVGKGRHGRKSRFPHHKETIILIRKISVLWLFYCPNRGILLLFIDFLAKI